MGHSRLGRTTAFTTVPNSACEQVIVASGKGWWCRGSCWCRVFVSRFEVEFVPKSAPRDPLKALRNVPGEEEWKKKESLPPLRQGTEGKAAPSSFP